MGYLCNYIERQKKNEFLENRILKGLKNGLLIKLLPLDDQQFISF